MYISKATQICDAAVRLHTKCCHSIDTASATISNLPRQRKILSEHYMPSIASESNVSINGVDITAPDRICTFEE